LSGLVLSPGAILTLISLPLVGRLLAKHQARWLVVLGLLILASGMYALSLLNLYTSFGTFVLVWMISRGGLGFLFVPINVAAFSFVPKERMNSATGLINLARNIGGSVGISLVTTMQARLAQRHQVYLVKNYSPLDWGYQEALHRLAGALQVQGINATDAIVRAYPALRRTPAPGFHARLRGRLPLHGLPLPGHDPPPLPHKKIRALFAHLLPSCPLIFLCNGRGGAGESVRN
jgi:DHA2 family multidrug resistance protein